MMQHAKPCRRSLSKPRSSPIRSTKLALIGVAAIGLSLAVAAPALAAGWSVIAAPPSGQNAAIADVAASSDTNAWAVGSVGKQPLIDHWNGTTWSQTPAPTFTHTDPRGFARLNVVGASSASDAWAFGVNQLKPGYQQPLVMHWNGSSWTTVSKPFFTENSVADISPTDAYVVGGYIEQWNGSSWSALFNAPNPPGEEEGDLQTVSATSPSDVWAIGTYHPSLSSQSYDTYSIHWNGSSWAEVPMPLPSSSDPLFDFQLNSIDAISPANVWAVGEAGDNVAHYVGSGSGTPTGTLIEHYDGTRWSIVSSPSPGTAASLASVTANSAGDVWAVGSDTGAGGSQTLTENWNGSSWSVVPSPDVGSASVLTSVSTSLGASIVWAAGFSGTSGAENPLMLENG